MTKTTDYSQRIHILGARVLVRLDPPITTLGNGTLHKPDDQVVNNRETGVLLLVGSGVSDELKSSVGHRIVFSRFGGESSGLDEEDLLLVEETNVRAVLAPAPAAPRVKRPVRT